MGVKAVLKVGGSLSRGMGLPELCRSIARLSSKYPLLVIPGGGDFAEQVRRADRRFHLEDTVAHSMALLAMDQYGYLLNQLIPGSCLSADIDQACISAESGRASILLPSALILNENPLPHSWQVTSDTIAAWISRRIRCPCLILLKDVDGLLNPEGLIPRMAAEGLQNHFGGVDEYLLGFLAVTEMETWVINGLCPERLWDLLDTGRTTGTQISP